MKKYLNQLVNFQTVSTNASAIDACALYVADELESLGMYVKRHVSNGKPSLVATTRKTKSPKVMLQAHLDVVPANDQLFTLSEKDGKFFGRGVYDMKFAGACYLQLVSELQGQLDDYDFGIMISFDEEIGGQHGVKYLVEQGYSTEICILPDGGDDWKIETTVNAVWIIELTSTGLSAHGSRPWDGKNAIYSLFEAITDIRQLFGEQKPFQNSVTVSKIQGGEAFNQVPESATATLDMRFIDNKEYTRIKESITQIAHAKKLHIETIGYVGSQSVDLNHPHIKEFLRLGTEIQGKPMETTHSLGSSDACYFRERNIPTIVIRPVGGEAHSDNEWVDIKSLDNFYMLLKQYIEKLK